MMEELWQDEACAGTAPLSVPLGVDPEGKVRMLDLAKAPHLLIGGSTGSGKSVFIQSVLATLMLRNTPDEVRLLLIDPKMVEFGSLAHTPHLLMPVVTDCREAQAALRCLVDEMERRYTLMAQAQVRNLEAYNATSAEHPDRERMPYVVVAIDELADLKLLCPDNDIENALIRLAQKARAAGIHLIVGTQRPTVSVITGALKANIPTRLAFRVMQQSDSRTILDMNGAECLCGRGDALFSAADGSHYRVQCGFISDDTVSDLAEDTRGRFEMRYNEAFMDKVSAEVAALIERESERTEDGEDDWISDGAAHDNGEAEDGELFWGALLYVAKTRKVATSFLQRRFAIGYAHAADIIDRMELLGYVSAAEGGNKPRKVLISLEDAIEVAALNGVEDDEE